MSERYFVDERVGCVAVVDSRVAHGPGLHADSEAVVWYRKGQRAGERSPSWVIWEVPESLRQQADIECARLNRLDSLPMGAPEVRHEGGSDD